MKDGLLPITEWLGPSPWSERAIGIIDDIWKNAPIETPFGKIPTLNFEVNGDLLQACARLFWFTGERKYLDWAIRLGDYYLLGDESSDARPEGAQPRRPFLRGHQRSLRTLRRLRPRRAGEARGLPQAAPRAVRPPPGNRPQRARPDLPASVNTRTGEHSPPRSPTTGATTTTASTPPSCSTGTAAYRDAVRKALGNLKEHYTGQGGMCQSNTGRRLRRLHRGRHHASQPRAGRLGGRVDRRRDQDDVGPAESRRRHRRLARRRQLRAHVADVCALENAGRHRRALARRRALRRRARGRHALHQPRRRQAVGRPAHLRQAAPRAEHAPAARLPAHQPVPGVVHRAGR